MSLSPVAIKEANHHIQGLVKRVHDLEEQVKELSEALKKQNLAHAENLKVLPLRMNQTMKQKDEEIQMLKEKLQSSESVIERLVQEANKKEALFEHYKNRTRVLDKILKHREAFESIIACLDLIQDTETDIGSENAERETDLLDSWDGSEDINGNQNGMSELADSGKGTSYSSIETGIIGEGKSLSISRDEVFLPPDENPPPCFV